MFRACRHKTMTCARLREARAKVRARLCDRSRCHPLVRRCHGGRLAARGGPVRRRRARRRLLARVPSGPARPHPRARPHRPAPPRDGAQHRGPREGNRGTSPSLCFIMPCMCHRARVARRHARLWARHDRQERPRRRRLMAPRVRAQHRGAWDISQGAAWATHPPSRHARCRVGSARALARAVL